MISGSARAMSSKYYHVEGYYKDGEEQGKATSFWHGKASKEGGLIGQINDAQKTSPDALETPFASYLSSGAETFFDDYQQSETPQKTKSIVEIA